MDYFIKATDEQALWSALESANLVTKVFDPEDPLNQPPAEATDWAPTGAFSFVPKVQLDVIGVIYKATEETDEEGNPIMAPLEGFHANLRCDLTEEQKALLPLIEAPQMPYRVWA